MRPETTDTFTELRIPANPFPGLRPFDFEESHLFFGRDGQSEQLISKLSATHFLAVVGTSVARSGIADRVKLASKDKTK